MINRRYVAVEGPIGAGATSLARRLAEHWGATLAAERPQENPFLPRFNRQFQHHALSTQLTFLLQRAEMAQEMLHGDLLGKAVVSDFMFEKDALFASINLDDAELALYRQLSALIEREPCPTPDLVIYLQATPETLMARLLSQKQDIPEGYLKRVHGAYGEFFYQYEAAPLLIVNTDHLNLVESKEDFDLLLRCITEMRGQRSYFNKSV
jgi:deoxyadenosine/deoxycytidine kinase